MLGIEPSPFCGVAPAVNKAVIKNGREKEKNIYSAHTIRMSSSNKITGKTSTKKLLETSM